MKNIWFGDDKIFKWFGDALLWFDRKSTTATSNSQFHKVNQIAFCAFYWLASQVAIYLIVNCENPLLHHDIGTTL